MEISISERRVRLSVGEFAAYSDGPEGGASASFFDPHRAQVGREWHARLRDETAQASPDAGFEIALSVEWQQGGWTFAFSGRVDQLLRVAGGLRVREVKSVSDTLPLDESQMRARHPDHFRQLAAYVCLTRAEGGESANVDGELCCVHARTGQRQAFPMDADAALRLFTSALERMCSYLEDCRAHRLRAKTAAPRPAFARLREGQARARDGLLAAAAGAKIAAFEAPTGFGKTGLLLEAALETLRTGRFSRVLYLTGKSTGQLAAAKQLRAMNADGAWRFYQMRNRREHAIRSKLHTCAEAGRCRDEQAAARWSAAGVALPDLFKNGEAKLENIRALGAKIGVCPYEISRALLPYADVWICDYNYVFAPDARGFLDSVFGFCARDTLLVIDEAHNLPERVCAAYSHAIDTEILRHIEDTLALAAAPRAVRLAAGALSKFVGALPQTDRMDDIALYDLENLVAALAERIAENFSDFQLDDLAAENGALWDALFAPARWLDFLRSTTLHKLVWAQERGEARLTCLAASEEIAATLDRYGAAIFASATLSPSAHFAAAVGAKPDSIAWICAKAPWHEGAFSIAIDARVDTRLSQRERHYETTARTVCAAAQGARGAVAVFFPSYRYAEAVAAYLSQIDPFLRVAIQPRGLDLAQQRAFLDEGLLTAHALFLVLGGGFAESIDGLGGNVERAVVVGPALPEVNPVRQARLREALEAFGGDHDAAFRAVYQVPAMRKINQALGRLVRAPGQRAKILLHCRRFDEKPYRELLAAPVPSIPVLRDDNALAAWLRE